MSLRTSLNHEIIYVFVCIVKYVGHIVNSCAVFTPELRSSRQNITIAVSPHGNYGKTAIAVSPHGAKILITFLIVGLFKKMKHQNKHKKNLHFLK